MKRNFSWPEATFLHGVLAVLLASRAYAQEVVPPKIAPPVSVTKTHCKILLDGKDDEPCWRDAATYRSFSEYMPESGRKPLIETRYRLIQDADNLYVFVECDDPDTEQLRIAMSRRDKVGADQDFVSLYIDPIGKRSFSQLFRVNSAGSISDGTYNEASATENLDQDFDFEVKTHIQSKGWNAEFKIPLRELRTGETTDLAKLTLLVARNYPRQQNYLFTSAELSRYSDCYLCRNSEIQGMTLPADPSFLKISPFVVIRNKQERHENGTKTNHAQSDAGVDIKARFGSSWLIDATFKPDFSQVEIDAPQLAANARFGLYFQEKRPFFLEGADLLDTPLSLIYTRSIAKPQVGVRLTHRTDASDALVIAVKDLGGGAILYPGAFASIPIVRDTHASILLARTRYHLQPGIDVGAIASSRNSADGTRNAVISGDVVWQIDGKNKVRFQLATSETSGDQRAKLEGSKEKSGLGTAFFVDHSFYGDTFDSLLTYERISPSFRSENGFISQAGHERVAADLTLRLGKFGWFDHVHPYVSLAQIGALGSNTVSRTIHPAVLFLGPYSTGLLFESHFDQIRLDALDKEHHLHQLLVSFKIRPSASVSLIKLDAELGRRLDYTSGTVGPGLRLFGDFRLRLGRQNEVAITYNKERIDTANHVHILTDENLQFIYSRGISSTSWLRLILQAGLTDRRLPDQPNSMNSSRKDVLSLVYSAQPLTNLEVNSGVTIGGTRENHLLTTKVKEIFIKSIMRF